MIAEDYADQPSEAEKLYQIVRARLLNCPERNEILTVMYVLDSILKNAKGCYIAMVERDAVEWMPTVYTKLQTQQSQQKLQKVWRTWNEFHLFDTEQWKAMGRCFSDTNAKVKVGGGSMAAVAGISRTVCLVLWLIRRWLR